MLITTPANCCALPLEKDPRLLFDPLTRPQAECLAELAAQRMQRVPLQYLAGEWDFLGLTFKVGPGVLCPPRRQRGGVRNCH